MYNVAHGVKSKAQLDALIAFFHARKGRAEGFRFKDWGDYQAINQPLGTGDGAQTDFQLVKSYASGDSTTLRTITKPVEGSVSVYLDGVLTQNVTVDSATGIVSFNSAPASGTTISTDCEFDVPVRFETDQLAARLDDYGLYSWGDIPLVEIRV